MYTVQPREEEVAKGKCNSLLEHVWSASSPKGESKCLRCNTKFPCPTVNHCAHFDCIENLYANGRKPTCYVCKKSINDGEWEKYPYSDTEYKIKHKKCTHKEMEVAFCGVPMLFT